MTPITADIDKLRLEIGDLASADQLYTDDQLTYFLDSYGSVLGAAAAACDALAARFARDFDFQWKDQKFSRSQMSRAFAQQAAAIRARSDATPSVLSVCRERRHRFGDLRDVFDRFGWSCDFDVPLP
jgi:hypothetical protein